MTTASTLDREFTIPVLRRGGQRLKVLDAAGPGSSRRHAAAARAAGTVAVPGRGTRVHCGA